MIPWSVTARLARKTSWWITCEPASGFESVSQFAKEFVMLIFVIERPDGTEDCLPLSDPILIYSSYSLRLVDTVVC